jgi:hypothetical protein
MFKEDYKKIIEEKPWQEMEQYFNDLPVARVPVLHTLDIDTQEWIDFTVENFDLAQQKWESPKEHYSEYSNEWASVNNQLGRNEHNTFELNYGMLGDSNEKLKTLLGDENIKKLKADPDSILMRLIVKMPGHGIAWHLDDAGSYKTKFPNADISKLKRLWFPVQDWKDGHAFQISKTVITHWKAGQVHQIPFGLGHASSNFGYTPQYTVSFTGLIND